MSTDSQGGRAAQEGLQPPEERAKGGRSLFRWAQLSFSLQGAPIEGGASRAVKDGNGKERGETAPT
jgi:hypothetical protein